MVDPGFLCVFIILIVLWSVPAALVVWAGWRCLWLLERIAKALEARKFPQPAGGLREGGASHARQADPPRPD